MRVPGYCTECHRVKQVTVTSAGMVALHSRGTAHGICHDCEQLAEAKRRWPRGLHVLLTYVTRDETKTLRGIVFDHATAAGQPELHVRSADDSTRWCIPVRQVRRTERW